MRAYRLLALIPLSFATLAFAQTRDPNPTLAIEQLIREDGTLDLHGTGNSVDLGSWRIETPESESPVFSKSGATAVPGDELWDGFPVGFNGPVRGLVFDGNGNLYAAGSFTTAGGAPANRIARWDGSSWSALGAGLNNRVNALAVDGSGNVYAGGEFTEAGGVPAGYVAKWDGSVWSALDGGVSGGGQPDVRALLVDRSGDLYVGGAYREAGGVLASNISKWDGAGWNTLGTGATDGSVLALASDRNGNVYAGGYFSTLRGISAQNIAKWDGSSWSAFMTDPVEFEEGVWALAVDRNGNLYAAGEDLPQSGPGGGVSRWDYPFWTTLGFWRPGSVRALAVDGSGNLFVGGSFSEPNGVAGNNIAKWDGSNWSALGSGTDGMVLALTVGTPGVGGLWLGGDFAAAGTTATNSIAKWNGPVGEATAVSVTAFLEGPYTGAGQMSTDLGPHLPERHPFNIPPWGYTGQRERTSIPVNTVDWILMELRSQPTSESLIARKAVFLRSDGSVVETSGTDPPTYWGVPDDSVYVVLRPRNHLPVMTPEKTEIVAGVATHDFTSSVSAAYSDGGSPLKDLDDGPFGLFAGDANADGFVQALDYNAYIVQTTSGASGYQSADFNLDGNVQALDFNVYVVNTLAGASSQVP